jgi:hypothetical protein
MTIFQKNRESICLDSFVCFILLLGAGSYCDFYAFPSPIAVLVGIIAAFLLFKSSTDEK